MDADISIKNKPKDLNTLLADANEALTYLDTKLATEVQIGLEDVLSKGVVNQKNRQELETLLAKIKFVRFTSLTDGEVEDLITDNLILAFGIENFSLMERIGKRLIFNGVIDLQIEFMDRLVHALEHCKSKLGSRAILSEGKTYEPTIANWLRLYFEQPAKTALRTNIEEWSFIEQNLPAKYLEKSDRNILFEVLKIYDSLRNRVYSYRSLPESDDEKEIFPEYDLYLDLPGLTINEEDPEWKQKHENILDPKVEEDVDLDGLTYMVSSQATLPSDAEAKNQANAVKPVNKPPVAPPLNKESVNIQEIIGKRQVPGSVAGIKTPPPAPEVMAKPAPPGVRPVNIEDILKNKNQTAPQAGTPSLDAKQAQIDRKLEELKKKVEK